MQNNIEKLTANTTLTKLLCVKQISELIGKEFAITLKKADLFFKASENYKLQETKDELKKSNIEFKDKYDYFLQMFGCKKSWTADLIKVGGLDSKIISDYLETKPLSPSIANLLKFIKGDENKADETTDATIDVKPENLKISVGKDNKISVKGTADETALLLIMEEIKIMLEKVRKAREVKAA